jgi:hypothetical protein
MKHNTVLRQALESFGVDNATTCVTNDTCLSDDYSMATDDTPLMLTESGQAVEVIIQDGQQFMDAASSLEAIYFSLESMANDGVNANTAQFVDSAIKAAVRPLKVTPPMIASFESFDRRPVAATRLSMESVGEWMKQLWESFKHLLNKLWSTIQDFFKQLFDSNEKVRQYAHKLEIKAAAVKGSAQKKFITLTDKQTRAISTDHGVILPAELATMRDYVWFNHLAMSVSDGQIAKNQAEIAGIITTMIAEASADDLNKYVDVIAKIELPIPDLFNTKKTEEGKTVYWSPVLPGMIKFSLTVNPPVENESVGPQAAFNKAHDFAWSKFAIHTVGENVVAETHYPVMSLDQIRETCNNAIKAVEWMSDLKKNSERKDRELDYIVGRVVLTDRDVSVKSRIAIAAVVKTLSRSEMLRNQVMMKTAAELMMFVRTALHIAETSLAQYAEA